MSGISSSIGLSGLLAAQRGMEVVGHNLANVSTPGYTRQSLRVGAARPEDRANVGQVGRGVEMLGTARIADLFMDSRLEAARSANGADVALASRLLEAQALMGADASDGLGQLLGEAFAASSALAARPADLPTRRAFSASLDELARGFRDGFAALEGVVHDTGAEIQSKLRDVNQLSADIADLNREIVRISAEGQAPNDLIDQRALAAQELAALTGSSSTVRNDGSLDVTLGGRPLVSSTRARVLTATPTGDGTVQVAYQGTSEPLTFSGGELSGLADAQAVIGELQGELDTLARSVMAGFNQVQATGVPLSGPYTSLTTANPVSAPDVPLSEAGLAFPPGATEIAVTVTDLTTGATSETRITIDPDRDSLHDVAAAIGGVGNVSAIAGPDGLLRISGDAGYGFDFAARDESVTDPGGLLSALGVSPLFTGAGAADMRLTTAIDDDPNAIAAGLVGGSGDGRNAARFVQLDQLGRADLDGAPPSEYFAALVASAGESARSAERQSETSHSALESLEQRRDGISGVSVEEEVASMLGYQRAFEAAARFLQIVDELSDELMSIVR